MSVMCLKVMSALQAVVNLPTETALVYVVIPAEQRHFRDHDAFLEEVGQRLVKVKSCSKSNYVLSALSRVAHPQAWLAELTPECQRQLLPDRSSAATIATWTSDLNPVL